MKGLRRWYARLPIRWKLTIFSTMVLCLVVVAFLVYQQFVLRQTAIRYKEDHVIQTVEQIQSHLENVPGLQADTVSGQRDFLMSINDDAQLIRILSPAGEILVAVTNDVPPEWVAPRTESRLTSERVEHEEGELLVVREPIRTAHFNGTLEIVRNIDGIDQLLLANTVLLLIGTAEGIVIAWFVGVVLTRRFLKPLKGITQTMRRIQSGGLQERVPVTGAKDEIAEVGEIFNEMMDRLERSFQQQQQFVEDASHELRTPLTVLHGHLSLLNRWGKDDPAVLEESLAAMTAETQRLNKLVQELLELTRAEGSEPEQAAPVLVKPVVLRVADNLGLVHPEMEFRLQFQGADEPQAWVKAEHLEQVLVILLDNAVHYGQPGKRVDVKVESRGNRTSLSIRDYGEGIAQEDLPYLFDRFYRADKSRSRQAGGNGLGLSIAKRLVERYGGTIGIESEIGEGTTVTVAFRRDGNEAKKAL